MTPTTINLVGTAIFALAILHTFSTKVFERLAHASKVHAGFWHLLAEVEVVFGFWAMVFICFLFFHGGQTEAVDYLEGRNFTEPLFVFVIMVIAASKPIFNFSLNAIRSLAAKMPMNESISFFFITLSVVPLLGSFITEPAAMTLAALLLRDHFYSKKIPINLMYATIGVLFVNVSIGGALTPYAAPPILMVAEAWGWDIAYMMEMFGWRSALAVFINATVVTLLFSNQIRKVKLVSENRAGSSIPISVTLVHILFLVGVVYFAHHSVIFIGLFLFFIGFTAAYQRYQSRLLFRESFLVGFFLGGLVVLGAQQKWWLQPLIASLDSNAIFFGATALTAITDNAALTYLGSLVEGLSAEFKYALVAGAIAGGGLTVIANAPNPAGYSILQRYFDEGAISSLKLFLYALPPTVVAVVCFHVL
jgi:hypothetical protein|nr:putative Na+/H+ antiporter [uncultured Polynucleobacter sp.]